jgi:branched-chain amino acid transport system substrate-binding protein
MRKFTLSLLAGACMTLGSAAYAASPPVKIGILTDMSGTYASMGGPGSVAAARLAIEDCLKAECKGMQIDLVSADNQNKADVGAARAREWFDRDGVTAIADLTNSAVALAVQSLAKEKNKVALFSGPATTGLTNDQCSPVGFHWMFDVYSQSVGGVKAMIDKGGQVVVLHYGRLRLRPLTAEGGRENGGCQWRASVGVCAASSECA